MRLLSWTVRLHRALCELVRPAFLQAARRLDVQKLEQEISAGARESSDDDHRRATEQYNELSQSVAKILSGGPPSLNQTSEAADQTLLAITLSRVNGMIEAVRSLPPSAASAASDPRGPIRAELDAFRREFADYKRATDEQLKATNEKLKEKDAEIAALKLYHSGRIDALRQEVQEVYQDVAENARQSNRAAIHAEVSKMKRDAATHVIEIVLDHFNERLPPSTTPTIASVPLPSGASLAQPAASTSAPPRPVPGDPRRVPSSTGAVSAPPPGFRHTAPQATPNAALVFGNFSAEEKDKIFRHVLNGLKKGPDIKKAIEHYLLEDTNEPITPRLFKTAPAQEAIRTGLGEAPAQTTAQPKAPSLKRPRVDDSSDIDSSAESRLVTRSEYAALLQNLRDGQVFNPKALRDEYTKLVREAKESLEGEFKAVRKEARATKDTWAEKLGDHDTDLDKLKSLPKRFEALQLRLAELEDVKSRANVSQARCSVVLLPLLTAFSCTQEVTLATLDQWAASIHRDVDTTYLSKTGAAATYLSLAEQQALTDSLRRDIDVAYLSKISAAATYASLAEQQALTDCVQVELQDSDGFRARVLCLLGLSDAMASPADESARSEVLDRIGRHLDDRVDIGPRWRHQLFAILQAALERDTEETADVAEGGFLYAIEKAAIEANLDNKNDINEARNELGRIRADCAVLHQAIEATRTDLKRMAALMASERDTETNSQGDAEGMQDEADTTADSRVPHSG